MIVAGFGCRAMATLASLESALQIAVGDHYPDLLATPADRFACVLPLAEALGLPLLAIEEPLLRSMNTPTQSPFSLSRRGVGSVAEAAALAAAGLGACIIACRHISPDAHATCALAEGPDR